MSFAQLGIAALVVYLVALVGVAEAARRARRDRSPADHFLAHRELGVWVLFLTLYASGYSGNSLLGYPGAAYRQGFSWIMATGFMLAIVVAFQILVPKLRPIAIARGFVTPGDWIRHRFDGERGARALALAVALSMSLALGNFLFAQLKAMGELGEQVTGGALPYAWGVLLLAAMVLFYETIGGMRAVAWTDAAQSLLMMGGLGALLAWLLSDGGGLGALTANVRAVRPEAVAVPDARECSYWASSIVLLGLASVVYPHAIQRIYAARSGDTLRRSLALMSFMPLTTTVVVTLIGLAAIPRLQGLGDLEADRVMPLLLSHWAEAGPVQAVLAVTVFIGALAAIMSTADSVLLSLGSMLAEDVLRHPRRQVSTTRLGTRMAALLMGLTAVAAIAGRDITFWGLIQLKMELLVQCVPAFLLAIHWSGFRALPGLLGLLAGSGVTVAGLLLEVPRIGGVHSGLVGLGVNLAVTVLGSSLVAGGAGRGIRAGGNLPRP